MDFKVHIAKLIEWSLSTGMRIVFILILMFILLRVASIISKRIFPAFGNHKDDPEFQKRSDTLSSIVRHTLIVTIIIMSAMMILRELGIEIGPIMAAAGVVGLAVGFGAQSLVKDIIGGFFILLEDQFRVGDVIQIADKGGLVERLNLKTTILRDVSGNVHYIPNGQINAVTNMTKDFSRYVFEIGVAYRESVEEVIEIMKEVDEELRNDPEFKDDIISPIEIMGLDKFADSALIIKARTTTKPSKQWQVGREFNLRLKKRFDDRNIEIPFPHVTLYLGEDKEGQAPPLRVDLKKGHNLED